MELEFSLLNWFAFATCLVLGQAFLSVWFIALFPLPWAQEYGVSDPKQHTREIPVHTYIIQAICTLSLTIAIAGLQQMLNIGSLSGGLVFEYSQQFGQKKYGFWNAVYPHIFLCLCWLLRIFIFHFQL